MCLSPFNLFVLHGIKPLLINQNPGRVDLSLVNGRIWSYSVQILCIFYVCSWRNMTNQTLPNSHFCLKISKMPSSPTRNTLQTGVANAMLEFSEEAQLQIFTQKWLLGNIKYFVSFKLKSLKSNSSRKNITLSKQWAPANKHLKNTKLYSIELLRTKITSDHSNSNREYEPSGKYSLW